MEKPMRAIPNFCYIVEKLKVTHLAYLHLQNQFTDVSAHSLLGHLRSAKATIADVTKAPLAINAGFDQKKNKLFWEGLAWPVVFGKPYYF